MSKKQQLVLVDAELVKIIQMLLYSFGNDTEKVAAFMNFENLNLGGYSPTRLINLQRGHKVIEFIEDAQNGNLA